MNTKDCLALYRQNHNMEKTQKIYIVCMLVDDSVNILWVFTDYTKAITRQQARIAWWKSQTPSPHKIMLLEYDAFISLPEIR